MARARIHALAADGGHTVIVLLPHTAAHAPSGTDGVYVVAYAQPSSREVLVQHIQPDRVLDTVAAMDAFFQTQP